MSKRRYTDEEVESAKNSLRIYFTRGSSITTVIDHVSQSGMTRWIRVLGVVSSDDRIDDVSYLVRRLVNQSTHRAHHGVKVDGAGMDMGFALAYDLGRILYGDGYALKHNGL